MRQFSRLFVFCRRFAKALLAVSIGAVLLIASIGAADAVMSVVGGRPIPAVFEFTELLVAIIIFMTQPFLLLTWSHIAVDLFTLSKGSVLRTVRTYLVLALSMLSYATIAVGAWRSLSKSVSLRELSSGIISIPVYPFKIGLFVGVCATILVIAVMIFMPHDQGGSESVGEI